MTDQASAITIREDFAPIVEMVVNGLDSPHSKRVYESAISLFLNWWDAAGRPPMTKALVQDYKVNVLDKKGLSPSTINQRLSAIRRLALEASDNGLIDQPTANGIAKVKGVKTQGVRSGQWLTKDQAQRLINTPDISNLKGLRDRVILALMIGAGLRRSEVAELTFDDIQQREGRWVIVDLVGKGNRIRTVPIPSWVKVTIDEWAVAANIDTGKVIRGVMRFGGSLKEGEDNTTQMVWRAVEDASKKAGLDVAPHDLRRTFAHLARKGGAELTQIQLTLGHANVATTQRYIGEDLNLTDAACDRLGLNLAGD